MEFGDITSDGSFRSTFIDLSVGADGARPTTTVVVEKYDPATDKQSVYEQPCAGAHASPDYTAGKVTYTLPAECLRNYNQSAADMSVFSGRWSKTDWRRVTADEYGSAPGYYDLTDNNDTWTWDRSVPTSSPSQHQP